MRIFLLQHALTDRRGHWFNETLGWMAAARRAGVPLKVYGARTMEPEVSSLTGAKGVHELTPRIVSRFGLPGRFTKTPEPHCQPMINFMAWSEAFREACTAVADDDIGGDDLLVVPFASINEVHGAALWLDTLHAGARPAVLFNFHEPHYAWAVGEDRDRVRGDFTLSRYAGFRLRALLPAHKILVTAAEPRLCRLLEQALGVRCHLAPMLMNYDAFGHDAAPVDGRAKTPILAVMGDFRGEKGSGRIVQIFLAVHARVRAWRFSLQVRHQEEAVLIREEMSRTAPDADVDIEFGALSRDLYYSRLQQSNLLLLPYSRDRYALRTSGVFAEAVACGRPVVVPAKTWMADCLQSGAGAGVAFDQPTPESIADAVQAATSQIDELARRARHCAPNWREQQSIDTFLARLLELNGTASSFGPLPGKSI